MESGGLPWKHAEGYSTYDTNGLHLLRSAFQLKPTVLCQPLEKDWKPISIFYFSVSTQYLQLLLNVSYYDYSMHNMQWNPRGQIMRDHPSCHTILIPFYIKTSPRRFFFFGGGGGGGGGGWWWRYPTMTAGIPLPNTCVSAEKIFFFFKTQTLLGFNVQSLSFSQQRQLGFCKKQQQKTTRVSIHKDSWVSVHKDSLGFTQQNTDFNPQRQLGFT